MEWRLNGNLIFRISSDSNNEITVSKTKGAYGERLQLNNQTGDLKITNIKTTDSGEYKLKITSTRGSSEKIFNVSGEFNSGLSPGAKAGIVITVIAAAAAAVGVIVYCYWNKEQKCPKKLRRHIPDEAEPLIKKNSPNSFRTKPM
ncbi:uncharacterized protein LOC143735336 [Siphateles boraxobius]|uniref:uncharacterized protein LOC143735336 n=1 Tax=Siphateles boraxobius TaxID=180520 RepID=UPI00406323C1